MEIILVLLCAFLLSGLSMPLTTNISPLLQNRLSVVCSLLSVVLLLPFCPTNLKLKTQKLITYNSTHLPVNHQFAPPAGL